MTQYLDSAIQTFDTKSIEFLGRLISISGSRLNSYELCRFLIRNQQWMPSFRDQITKLTRHIESNLQGLEKIDYDKKKTESGTKEDAVSILRFIANSLQRSGQKNVIASPSDQKRRLLRVQKPTLLREYQEECVVSILEGLRHHGNSQLLVLPTGAGKTKTAMEAIREWIDSSSKPIHVLWSVHSEPLCKQAELSFESIWEQDREISNISELWLNVVYDGGMTPVSSLYGDGRHSFTIVTPDSVDRWAQNPPCKFDLIVVDEAHHGIGEQNNRVFRLPHSNKLGLTATPDLTTDAALFSMTYRELVMPVQYTGSRNWRETRQRMITEGILSNYQIRDESMKDIVARLGLIDNFDEDRPWEGQEVVIPVAERMCTEMLQRGASQILIFCDGVPQCEMISTTIRNSGVPAESIHGHVKPRERATIFSSFDSGETKVIVSVDILREGVDLPSTDGIIILRRSQSTLRDENKDKNSPMFNQMIGRGLRGPMTPRGTEKCEIVLLS